MRHCVASYDTACLSGGTFIYHVGAPAPEGSTLQISPEGRVLQHRAAANRRPDSADRERVGAWLAQYGIDSGSQALMAALCARLRTRGINSVGFEIYWYLDEDTVDAVEALDAQGSRVALDVVTDDELYDLVREENGDVYGAWMLHVDEARLEYCGEAEAPEDEEEWDDDEYEIENDEGE